MRRASSPPAAPRSVRSVQAPLHSEPWHQRATYPVASDQGKRPSPVVQRRTWEASVPWPIRAPHQRVSTSRATKPATTIGLQVQRHRTGFIAELKIFTTAPAAAARLERPTLGGFTGDDCGRGGTSRAVGFRLPRGWRRASRTRRRGRQIHSRISGLSDMPACHRDVIAVYAPAHTHDLLRLSHVGLHLFVSPNALQRPLCAS